MILVFVPGRTVLQVYQDRSRISLVIGITVQGCMDGRSQFCLYARFIEGNCVISRCSALGGFLEAAAVAVPVALAVAGNRHYQNIAQVHTAGTVQVSLGESPDDGITVDIFRAVTPSHCSGYGAGLYHPKGTTGSRECMTVVGCSDERIDVLGIIYWGGFLLCGGTACQETCECQTEPECR